MLTNDDPLFIVDMNDLEAGDLVTIALDFTVNHGPFVTGPIRTPQVGGYVKIHCDDDDVIYFAKVMSKRSDRDYVVKVLWKTCAPVLNREWSARPDDVAPVSITESASVTSGK